MQGYEQGAVACVWSCDLFLFIESAYIYASCLPVTNKINKVPLQDHILAGTGLYGKLSSIIIPLHPQITIELCLFAEELFDLINFN